MSAIEIAWTVVGVVVPVLVGTGYTCVGLVPPEFRRARYCFYFAATVLGGMEIVWYTQTGWPFIWRVAVASLICLTIGIGLPETLRWMHKRESSGSLPISPPLAIDQLKEKEADHPLKQAKRIEPISIEFGAFMANMGQDLNSRGWWALYQSSFGSTMTPLALVIRLTITNNQEIPVNIAHYSLAVDTQICGWTYLIPMHPSVTQGVALVDTGFTDVGIFEFQSNSLAIAFKQPIPAHTAIDGWLLFNTTTKCPPSPGGTIRFRLELQDTAGKDYSILSPSKSFNSDISSSRSTGDVRLAELKFTGKKLDLTQVQKKLWSDLPK